MSLIEKTTEIGNSIIALIDAKTGGAPDGKTVKSTDGVMSAIGVKESNKDKAIKTWVGTLAEYEALESVDENTLYNITDDVEGEEVFNTTKVNLDGSNYEGSGLQTVVDSNLNSKMTNCITEIPQRIKYTLVDGTLTIKAGSVVIVPYGTEDKTAEFPVGARFLHDDFKVYDTQFDNGKFFVWAEFVNDSGSSRATTDTYERFLNIFVTVDTHIQGGLSNSSGTEPIKNHMIYNPETNLIQYYENSDAMTVLCDVCALPWGRCKANGTSVFGEILQVFNGMGYIGSTIWVDKGVKGLIPNGRNEDGTLNNNILSTNKLIVRTFEDTVNTTCDFLIGNNYVYYGVKHVSGTYYYDTENNHNISGGNILPAAFATTGSIVSGVIKYISLVRPLNIAGTPSEISSYAMPSDKYVDLSASQDGVYVAPANGWFIQNGASTATNQRNVFVKNGILYGVYSSSTSQTLNACVPVCQGEEVTLKYSVAPNILRFYYAQGEV